MKSKIHHTIMRRVYYSYTVSVLSQSTLWQGFLLGACIALFGRLTHVASIAHNFTNTRLENTPAFVWHSFVHALMGGEVLTVLVVLFMVGLTVSCVARLTPLLFVRPAWRAA